MASRTEFQNDFHELSNTSAFTETERQNKIFDRQLVPSRKASDFPAPSKEGQLKKEAAVRLNKPPNAVVIKNKKCEKVATCKDSSVSCTKQKFPQKNLTSTKVLQGNKQLKSVKQNLSLASNANTYKKQGDTCQVKSQKKSPISAEIQLTNINKQAKKVTSLVDIKSNTRSSYNNEKGEKSATNIEKKTSETAQIISADDLKKENYRAKVREALILNANYCPGKKFIYWCPILKCCSFLRSMNELVSHIKDVHLAERIIIGEDFKFFIGENFMETKYFSKYFSLYFEEPSNNLALYVKLHMQFGKYSLSIYSVEFKRSDLKFKTDFAKEGISIKEFEIESNLESGTFHFGSDQIKILNNKPYINLNIYFDKDV